MQLTGCRTFGGGRSLFRLRYVLRYLTLTAIGRPAIRFFGVVWLVSIPSLVIGAGLQGLSLGAESMVLTMLRQAVLPILLALIMKPFGILELIWGAVILSELFCVPLAIALWRRGERNALSVFSE